MVGTILVVEDSPTQAERLRLLLEGAGYRVVLAANGQEGLERVHAAPPDLIISDVVMPQMDGYAFCQAVKLSERTKRIPFVLLTERNTPADLIKGLEQGADNFITKPFEGDYLLERVRRIFENLELRERGHLEMEVTVRVRHRQIVLSADKQQIIELLFSTYEALDVVNSQLAESQCLLEEQARNLEVKVEERTKELREREEQLRQSQKMEAVGRLAGGVAHDFNNLLTIITGRSLLLLNRLPIGDPLRPDIETIHKTAERAAALPRQLLAFSRKQVLQPKVLDLNTLVGNIEPLLRRLIGEDIEIVIVPEPMLGRVKADPGQLEQVILNLVVNARDAMPQGGRLTIETANVELDEAYASRHVGVRPGQHVMLAVSDTGCGMDAETQTHVFEPFFTTKGPEKGTGLGLATVYGIVKQSGGNIWVYSELGRGTTFKIYLPRVEGVAEVTEPIAAPPEPRRGSETVLLVEDDQELRQLTREILELNGYNVLEAGDVHEAVSICERHADPIHLLLTDMVMPGASGQQLAERLLPVRPAMKVLYMSGYTDHTIADQGGLGPHAAFVQKPFTPETLASRIRQVLDGR